MAEEGAGLDERAVMKVRNGDKQKEKKGGCRKR